LTKHTPDRRRYAAGFAMATASASRSACSSVTDSVPAYFPLDRADCAPCFGVSKSQPLERKAHFLQCSRGDGLCRSNPTWFVTFLGLSALTLLLAKVLHVLAPKGLFRPKLVVCAT
jgi:hypothetical protein